MQKRLSLLLVLTIAALGQAGLAAAIPAPSQKPDLIAASNVLSTADAQSLRDGLNAVDEGEWTRVRQIERQLSGTKARDVLTWYRARRDVRMSFGELDAALIRLESWPEAETIRALAEDRLQLAGRDSAFTIEWFESHGGAKSGAGHLNYARALERSGNPDRALEEIRKAWHGRTLSRDLSQTIYREYRDQLTQDDHRKRVDFLLWTRQTSDAARLKSLLTRDWQALVDARIRLIRRYNGVDRAIDAVPTALRTHPGLLFDRAQWRRRSGMTSRVTELLRDIDGADVPPAGRSRLWDERHLAVRRALKDGDWSLAYELSEPHGMSDGIDFAQAEWTAGWVALRYLDRPERGLEHFQTLQEGVGTPISKARAFYWTGRAHKALGDTAAATESFVDAAKYSYTYYGQLAAEEVDEDLIELPELEAVTPEHRAAFDAKPLVIAMRLFAENGWDASFRKFAYHLDDQLTTPQEFQLLAELGREYHYSDIGVRGAKAGMAKGVIAADAAYPLVEYPLLREPDVERSLMLALSRQESEMNPAAISHANARGLMQFVPRTAQLEARRQGLPFRVSWLTDDPGYNMTLGGAHLDTLLRQFNGSYIMTAAAYNAGASRPKRWVNDYGDPRAGEVDPIDWVEFIPFSETRNYVQRVLENTQVYRHRLSGEPESVRLSEDLRRGAFDQN
ncbi:MAG: transglycosylase SLT domain-containing protein [Pseudomonadota bacterium]